MAKRKTLPTADAAAEPAAPAIVIEHLGRVRLEDISDSPFNPRKRYDGEKLRELADAYRRCPDAIPRPLVRKRPIGFQGAGYELIHGHRRKRAAQLALLNELEVDVADVDDHTARMLQRAENALREDLHPLDEADWFASWLEDVDGATVEAIAAEIGRTPGYVRGRVKLAQLCEEGRKAIDEGLGVGQAQLIAGLPAQHQRQAVSFALTEDWQGRPTVKRLAGWIEGQFQLQLSEAPWNLADPLIGLPCTSCPKRTGANAELFGETVRGDRCLDRACWETKVAAWRIGQGELLKVSHDWEQRGADGPLPSRSWHLIEEHETRGPTDAERAEVRGGVEDGLREDLNIPPTHAAELEQRVKDEIANQFPGLCAYARWADIVMNGTTKLVRVCASRECPTHGARIQLPVVAKAPARAKPKARSSSSGSSPRGNASAKATPPAVTEEQVRRRALKLALGKLRLDRGYLPRAEVLELALRELTCGDLGGDPELVQDLVGWAMPKGRVTAKDLAKVELATLSRLLVVAQHCMELEYGQAAELLAFVKRQGVDVAKVRREMTAEAKAAEKVAAAAKAAPAAKKKARAKAGAGRSS